MVKLEDEDTGEIHYTNVACRFLDTSQCCCRDYDNRAKINSRCIVLSPDNLDVLESMPFTCVYRLVHEGRTLTGDDVDLSVAHRVVSEDYIHEDQLPDHIVEWIRVDGE